MYQGLTARTGQVEASGGNDIVINIEHILEIKFRGAIFLTMCNKIFKWLQPQPQA